MANQPAALVVNDTEVYKRPRRRPARKPPGMTKRDSSLKNRAIVRRNRALEMKIAGASYRQIASALAVSVRTAYQDVIRAAGLIEEDTARLAGKFRAIEGERLDFAHRQMMPLVAGQIAGTVKPGETGVVVPPDPVEVARVQAQAAGRITAISERRSKLFGLEAPVKLTATDATGTRRYDELSDEEIARQIQQKMALLGLPAMGPATPASSGEEDP